MSSRVTRASARQAPSPGSSSGTPTSNVSPIFSARTSVKAETETPVTSDDEALATIKKTVIRTSARKTATKASTVKRKVRDESDEEESEDELVKVETEVVASASTRASKRRVTVNRAYVEVVQKVRAVRRSSQLCALTVPLVFGRRRLRALHLQNQLPAQPPRVKVEPRLARRHRRHLRTKRTKRQSKRVTSADPSSRPRLMTTTSRTTLKPKRLC